MCNTSTFFEAEGNFQNEFVYQLTIIAFFVCKLHVYQTGFFI